MLKKYFQLKTWIVLTIIILVELAFNLLLQYYAADGKILYNSFAEELTLEEIESTGKLAQSYTWMSWVWAPTYILLQALLIAVCINVGTLLLRYDIKFKEIFGVVIKASGIFAVARLLVIAGYLYFGVQSLDDLNYLPNFSLYELLDEQAVPEWAIFPLQTINIVQILFILLLAFGLNLLQKRGMKRWVPVVLGTYGTGVAICTILIIFLVFL